MLRAQLGPLKVIDTIFAQKSAQLLDIFNASWNARRGIHRRRCGCRREGSDRYHRDKHVLSRTQAKYRATNRKNIDILARRTQMAVFLRNKVLQVVID